MSALGKRFSVPSIVGAAALLVLSCGSNHAPAAFLHHVRGDLYAYAHNANNGVPISREILAGEHTSVADSATQVGPSGNTATSSYYASLAAGALGSYVYGYGPHANEYGGGGASVEASVHMDDQLYVTIPAGTYAEDLYIALHGHIEGSISTSGIEGTRESNAYQTWYFNLGGPLGGDGMVSVRTPNIYPDDSPYIVDQDFILTARVLYAGEITSDRVVSLTITASLQSKGGALATYPYGDQVTSVLCDFYHTGEFTSFVLPEGCTWESASGVFLPEPTALLLIAVGLGAIRRRR